MRIQTSRTTKHENTDNKNSKKREYRQLEQQNTWLYWLSLLLVCYAEPLEKSCQAYVFGFMPWGGQFWSPWRPRAPPGCQFELLGAPRAPPGISLSSPGVPGASPGAPKKLEKVESVENAVPVSKNGVRETLF